jgi:hypothetical protein
MPERSSCSNGEPFTIAGLWENWKDPENGDGIRTFTLIMTVASKLVARARPTLAQRAATGQHHRMRPLLLCALLITFVLWTAAVFAQPANEVLQGCRDFLSRQSTRDFLRQGVCLGTVQGLAHAQSLACVPKGISNEQMIRVVLAFAETVPHRLQENFTSLASDALTQIWPCRR